VARKAVGANGKVLGADSTQTDGLAWVDRTMLFKTQSGAYFGAPNVDSGNGAAAGVGYCVVAPIIIPAAVSVDRIGIQITSATATALWRLGIYNDNGAMRPGSLLFDAGTVDASATGFKEITISQTLSAGIYWTAGIQQVASATAKGLQPVIPIPVPSANVGSAILGLADNGGNTSAIPSTFTVTFYQTANVPRIFLRAA
jgi:hypothetical protein